MGINISGIAINRNYENDFEELTEALGWKLQKQAEINFGAAVSNWKEKGICDVYFTENGTILFVNMELCIESRGTENDHVLTFILSETSMTFSLHYAEKGDLKRIFIGDNDKQVFSSGQPLEVEATTADMSNIIWNQLAVVIGKSFWDIEHGDKAFRYIFVDEKEEVKVPSYAPDEIYENETDVTKNDEGPKKWWEFWK
jgi:hypothetical protein